jgi:hypothetical protein
MALVQGIHILAHGNKAEARRIAVDIQQNQRLLIGTNPVYGAGAYAWYPHTMPSYLAMWPQVIFVIDDKSIVPVCKKDGTPLGFFRIPGSIGSYVSVVVQTFVNLS